MANHRHRVGFVGLIGRLHDRACRLRQLDRDQLDVQN